MMRNGMCFQRPPLAPLTAVKGLLLLPTPAVMDTQNVSNYLRSHEIWPKATCLTARLIGMEFNYVDREPRPPYRLIAEPSFVEWMMGVPKGWTDCAVSGMALCQT